MKRTVSLLIAVLMILSVFSICTVSALPDQDSQGRYRIDVKNGHAENYDGDTITYADAGEEVYVFYDAEVPEGSYIAGMSVNDQYYVDQSYFIMPNSVANIYFVLEPQQYLTVDFRGSNKAYIPVEARPEVTSAINHAIINGFIESTSTGFDLDKDGNTDVDYLFAVEKPFFRRIATCNIIGDYMLVLPKSNRKYNFIFSFGAPSIHKSSLSLAAGKTFTLKITDGAAKSWTTSSKSVATVTSEGVVTALKKGTATITAKTYSGKTLTCKVTVTSSPKLSKSAVTVKKCKTATVKITGKAPTVKNVYTNTKIAKITSKNTASKLTIKGLKVGSTTLKVKVNGVTLKLKVKVK